MKEDICKLIEKEIEKEIENLKKRRNEIEEKMKNLGDWDCNSIDEMRREIEWQSSIEFYLAVLLLKIHLPIETTSSKCNYF